MAHLVCFKCGSKHIDNGTSRILLVLGLVLMFAGVLAFYCSSQTHTIADWTVYTSLQQDDTVGIAVFCLGLFMHLQGAHHTERVRCLKCGSVWTPPKKRLTLKHLH